jgi:membrane-associated protein
MAGPGSLSMPSGPVHAMLVGGGRHGRPAGGSGRRREASTVIAVNPTDSASVLAAFGALGVLVVIFAESGLLVFGFFLPGDTLLFPAGVLCAENAGHAARLELWQVLLCGAVGAVVGGQVGYLIGRHGGQPLLARTSSRRLKETAVRAERFLARYGYGKALVLGRFVPMLRTVLHPAAGALGVPVGTFTLWQIVGGLLWSQTLVLAGYLLGSSVAHVDMYLIPMVAAIVVASLLPLLWEALRSRRGARQGRAGDGERATGTETEPATEPAESSRGERAVRSAEPPRRAGPREESPRHADEMKEPSREAAEAQKPSRETPSRQPADTRKPARGAGEDD